MQTTYPKYITMEKSECNDKIHKVDNFNSVSSDSYIFTKWLFSDAKCCTRWKIRK